MPRRNLKDWLTFAGAADRADVHPSIITRAVAADKLPAVATGDGKARLIHVADLDAWKSTAAPGRPKIN